MANQIDYNGQINQVKFIGSAVLRRYRGAVLGDETAGSLIVYNNANETFSVDGGMVEPHAEQPVGARVRARFITPRFYQRPASTGASGTSAAPGKPAVTAPATPAALSLRAVWTGLAGDAARRPPATHASARTEVLN